MMFLAQPDKCGMQFWIPARPAAWAHLEIGGKIIDERSRLRPFQVRESELRPGQPKADVNGILIDLELVVEKAGSQLMSQRRLHPLDDGHCHPIFLERTLEVVFRLCDACQDVMTFGHEPEDISLPACVQYGPGECGCRLRISHGKKSPSANHIGLRPADQKVPSRKQFPGALCFRLRGTPISVAQMNPSALQGDECKLNAQAGIG